VKGFAVPLLEAGGDPVLLEGFHGDVSGTDGAGVICCRELSRVCWLTFLPSRLDSTSRWVKWEPPVLLDLVCVRRMSLRRGLHLTWGIEQPQASKVLALHLASKN